MKKFLLWIIVILAGSAVTSLVFWSYQHYLQIAYRKSEIRSLDFNPYTYAKKTKASTSYFYKSLPLGVRNFMDEKKMNFDSLTSCEADLIPGGFSEFAISFFDGNKSNLLVISMENQYKAKSSYNLSNLIKKQRKSDQEYFEIHCLPSASVLNDKSFQLAKTEEHFVDQLRNDNQDLIAIQLSTDSALQIIAFESQDKKFHVLGILPSLQEPSKEEGGTSLPKKISPLFFTSLPEKIRTEIGLRSPNHESLTSCEGDVFPGRDPDYAVSYVANDRLQAFVFEITANGNLLITHDISSLIAPLRKSANDELEIQCRHGSYVLLNPNFKLKPSEKDLAIYFRDSNREVLRVKSTKSTIYSYFAYSTQDSSYHFIGTSDVP